MEKTWKSDVLCVVRDGRMSTSKYVPIEDEIEILSFQTRKLLHESEMLIDVYLVNDVHKKYDIDDLYRTEEECKADIDWIKTEEII